MDPQFYSLFRSKSIDSDATADNLPGPGRNLGRLFEHLGRKLENGIYSFAAGRRANPFVVTGAAPTLPQMDSTDSIDSNATADNLPGPGRNLGRLYAHLGNKFVDTLGKYLARQGFGPDAAASTIARIRRHTERDIRDLYVAYAMQSCSSTALTETERIKLEKSCKKLVKYSRSKADSTAISACSHIANLAHYDPYLKQILFDYLPAFDDTLVSELQYGMKEHMYMLELDPLLASSRKALISVTEVAFQQNWSEFYVASALGGLITMDKDRWYICMDSFLANFNHWFIRKDFALSFLGLRHILHTFQITTEFVTTTRDDEQWASRSDFLINVMHQLLSVFNVWLVLASHDDVSASTIDWETLEALVGGEGKEAVWVTRLRGLVSGEPLADFGVHGNGIIEDVEAMFAYEIDSCVWGFSALCQQKGHKWVPPALHKFK